MAWISVEDRLPDNESDVLIVTRSKNGARNIDKGYYIPVAERWAHRGTAEVTHWQPLPDLPDGGEAR